MAKRVAFYEAFFLFEKKESMKNCRIMIGDVFFCSFAQVVYNQGFMVKIEAFVSCCASESYCGKKYKAHILK